MTTNLLTKDAVRRKNIPQKSLETQLFIYYSYIFPIEEKKKTKTQQILFRSKAKRCHHL